ncbi:ABC transporter permease [Neorhizobium alkalisoli]|uniref:NitT/TauT family transport system permease protein n=1 Tax=Neorhizobium alkalisoli TaxID=528178 RepID=A0A561R9P4_9HYPH|nr:ABC transporter permease [Neorhizobium alkalisoli]TWF59321.1 NitT/TauT family transport system permease protein [Neorhizobium alkalisoli]
MSTTTLASITPARKRGMPASVKIAFERTLIVLAILLVWQVCVWTGIASAQKVSSPILVAGRLVEIFGSGMIWPHLFDTLGATLIALALSAVIGTALGIIISANRLVEATLEPLFVAIQGIPRVAFGPMIVLFLGVGMTAKVFLAVSIAAFVFMGNTQQGLKKVDPGVMRNLRLMGASRRQIMKMAIIPSLAPWLWSALDLSLGLAMIGVIIAEFISSTRGLGHLISAASLGFDTTGVITLLIVMMIASIAFRSILIRLRRRVFPWF